MSLTPHFTLDEMETTSTGISNRAPAQARERLRALCSAILEPLREKVGPLYVSSGYRSQNVNTAVGGSSTSQHMKGEAADIVPKDRPVAWAVLLDMLRDGFPIDQLVLYSGTNHIHVSHTARTVARRQALVKTADGRYVMWDSYTGPLKG